MPETFHFLQPLWFLALLPLALLVWWLPRAVSRNSSWQQACEAHLLPYLLDKPVQALNRLPVWLLAAGWLLAVVALADPVWQKQPQPVFRQQDASVIVLDLSRSMLSADLAPSRLERARYKVADILRQRDEGQTGLVVFAGDAFTVSPLTSDTHTIESLLKPLHPDLMPVQGSRADAGIRLAGELLRQAGYRDGSILLITDGYSDPATPKIAAGLRQEGYRLSVLGVGGDEPAPIPGLAGGFIRDASGQPVLARLDGDSLAQLASAGGGVYSAISTGDDDLKRLLSTKHAGLYSQLEAAEPSTEQWQSQGPWLILALLPLAALAFRRGWLLSLPLVMIASLGGLPQPVMASTWDDLWQRQDQQASNALQAGDYARARGLAETPMREGEAAYRSGDYTAALDAFDQAAGAAGAYNRGNALAQLGRYEEAVAAYDEALQQQPDMEDAAYNKAQVEALLEQQQQQQQSSQDGQDSDAGQTDAANDSASSDEQQSADEQSGEQQAGDQQADGAPESADAQASPPDSPQPGESQSAGNDTAMDPDEQEALQEQARRDAGEADSSDEAEQPTAADGDPAGESGQSDNTLAGNEQDDAEPSTDAPADSPMDTASLEQQQADERWLKRIPDDPGGLLRRKFLYQYSQRDNAQPAVDQQHW